MLKTTYKTPHQSIWRDVLDFENGTPCYIHMKAANRVYAGTLSVMEENGDDSYLCLAGYILTTGNSGEATHEEVNYENDIRRLIVLRLRDIDRIEINYKDGSSKIKKIEKPKKPKK
jgi:hypothetical protein